MRRPLTFASLAVTALAALGTVTPAPARALTLIAKPDSASVRHDRTLSVNAPGVLSNDLGILGGTVILDSDVAHGSLDLKRDGSYTYAPGGGYVGTDQFFYRVQTLILVSNAAKVTITVMNTTPVANPDTYTVQGRNDLVVPAPGVLGNDTDADGDGLTAEIVSASGISGSLNLSASGRLTYSPGGGFDGSVSFTYRVWDGHVWSAPATVTLTGTPSPTPTPSPTVSPTPDPTVRPTARPTPRPTPAPILPPVPTPPPLATLPPLATPGPLLTPPTASSPPGEPTPTPATSVATPPERSGSTEQPRATASGDASHGREAVPGAVTGRGPGDGANPGDGSGDVAEQASPIGAGGVGVQTGTRLDGVALDLGDLQLGELWYVPAGLLGLPGLLLLLWLIAEAAGGLVWLPAARRLSRGEAGPRAHRRSLLR